MKRASFGILLFGVAVVAGGPWSASVAAELEEHAAAINRAARASAVAEAYVIGRMSQRLDVPVTDLRAQRDETQLGWGEILLAHRLAREGSVPFEEVVADFKGGRSWAEIAQAREVDVDALVGGAREDRLAIEREATQNQGAAAGTGPSGKKGSGGGKNRGGKGAGRTHHGARAR